MRRWFWLAAVLAILVLGYIAFIGFQQYPAIYEEEDTVSFSIDGYQLGPRTVFGDIDGDGLPDLITGGFTDADELDSQHNFHHCIYRTSDSQYSCYDLYLQCGYPARIYSYDLYSFDSDGDGWYETYLAYSCVNSSTHFCYVALDGVGGMSYVQKYVGSWNSCFSAFIELSGVYFDGTKHHALFRRFVGTVSGDLETHDHWYFVFVYKEWDGCGQFQDKYGYSGGVYYSGDTQVTSFGYYYDYGPTQPRKYKIGLFRKFHKTGGPDWAKYVTVTCGLDSGGGVEEYSGEIYVPLGVYKPDTHLRARAYFDPNDNDYTVYGTDVALYSDDTLLEYVDDYSLGSDLLRGDIGYEGFVNGFVFDPRNGSYYTVIGDSEVIADKVSAVDSVLFVDYDGDGALEQADCSASNTGSGISYTCVFYSPVSVSMSIRDINVHGYLDFDNNVQCVTVDANVSVAFLGEPQDVNAYLDGELIGHYTSSVPGTISFDVCTPGQHTFSLVAEDGTSVSKDFNVLAAPWDVNISVYIPSPGDVYLTASAQDESPDTLSYYWSVDLGGDVLHLVGREVNFTTDASSAVVELNVVDEDGLYTTKTVTFNPQGSAAPTGGGGGGAAPAPEEEIAGEAPEQPQPMSAAPVEPSYIVAAVALVAVAYLLYQYYTRMY